MDEWLESWAREARKLNLSALNVHDVPEAQVRQFALLVLEELAACGLVEGEEQVACWAGPRHPKN